METAPILQKKKAQGFLERLSEVSEEDDFNNFKAGLSSESTD